MTSQPISILLLKGELYGDALKNVTLKKFPFFQDAEGRIYQKASWQQ